MELQVANLVKMIMTSEGFVAFPKFIGIKKIQEQEGLKIRWKGGSNINRQSFENEEMAC